MSSVCDLGTIRSIIRGVDEAPPHTLLAEMIDDADHSNSKQVFVDINSRDKQVVLGFEHAATQDQLNKMVEWNPTSEIHSTSNISTCGQGLKYYEFRFRGEQTHAAKTWDETKQKFMYRKSILNSDDIYKSAKSPDVSESAFSEVLKKNTTYANRISDEIETSLGTIFENKEDKYPFDPKTIIISKDIANDKLLDQLDSEEHLITLEKELINKYYEEINSGALTIHIKFPKDKEFRILGQGCNTDIIGSTDKQNEHITELFYIETNFEIEKIKFKKGDYLISINGKMFRILKMGNSYARTQVTLSNEDYSNLLHQFRFIQYNVRTPTTKEEEAELKKRMVGTSMEDYCGVYLKIGDKFIDGRPISCNLTKRNLQGAKFYRGILQLMNPKKTKMMLGIHGLKSEFNLSRMNSLEQIIKQCCTIYKNFCGKYKETIPIWSTVDPSNYCVVETSNTKTVKTSKPGNMYLRVVGTNFYKLGITGISNRANRIFHPMTDADYETLQKDFPDEELLPINKQYYEYLSPEFDKCSSTEQAIKETIITLQDVITYDNKTGGDIREYFHCDNPETLHEIKMMMIDALDS